MAQTTYARLERAVLPLVRTGKLQRAIAACEAALAALPQTEYHEALGRSWTGQAQEASRWLADFCRTAAKAMPLRAVYCEMNRFEINPTEWYIDAFAYDFFGDPDDLGWLVGWKKATRETNRLMLLGMSDLQAMFARDYRDTPPAKLRAASEVVILLLALRMQELIDAAALLARRSGQLREDLPVLAATHDSDLVLCSYGRVASPITRPEPAKPATSPPIRGGRLGIYEIDGGYDEFGNSLRWDVLDYSRESDFDKYQDLWHETTTLAKGWKAPRVKLRQSQWRCDLIRLYPAWAVSEKARAALMPLLGKTVELLPLRCPQLPNLWALHPLRYIDLASSAIHNGEPGRNMTVIRRYAFDLDDLQGKHFFGIKQSPGSPSRKAGRSFGAAYVSEEFKRTVEAHGLQGVVFKKVFSYRLPKQAARPVNP
ncbi:MAG: hypothetical protein L0Y71_15380 [Gemmataceae bacterium]|nr:hypothetical protein [Gemmataceae bacterium]